MRFQILMATLLILGFQVQQATAETADSIIEASDKIRNPTEPFRTTTTLTEFIDGKAHDQSVLVVHAKVDPKTRQFRDLIRYVEPARDEGKMVLLDANSLWFYDPNSKASVRISPQQRVVGQASIADVLTVNFAVDYTGTITAEETIQDTERHDRHCWHLDLKAANDMASYIRAEYWVEKGTNYPVKGKFYADSGRLLKVLYYRSFEDHLGGPRPTEAIIIDGIDKSRVTTVKFGDYRAQDIPDAWFQREYLPRVKAE